MSPETDEYVCPDCGGIVEVVDEDTLVYCPTCRMEMPPTHVTVSPAVEWNNFMKELEACTTYASKQQVLSDARDWCIREMLSDIDKNKISGPNRKSP